MCAGLLVRNVRVNVYTNVHGNVLVNVYKYHVITTHIQYTRFLDQLILVPNNAVVGCHSL